MGRLGHVGQLGQQGEIEMMKSNIASAINAAKGVEIGAGFEAAALSGEANADATFQAPFAQPFPTPNSFPLFPKYSPTSTTTIYAVAPGFRPEIGIERAAEIERVADPYSL